MLLPGMQVQENRFGGCGDQELCFVCVRFKNLSEIQVEICNVQLNGYASLKFKTYTFGNCENTDGI